MSSLAHLDRRRNKRSMRTRAKPNPCTIATCSGGGFLILLHYSNITLHSAIAIRCVSS